MTTPSANHQQMNHQQMQQMSQIHELRAHVCTKQPPAPRYLGLLGRDLVSRGLLSKDAAENAFATSLPRSSIQVSSLFLLLFTLTAESAKHHFRT